MRAGWGAMVGILALSGCITVRLVQRDGCWVRQTQGFPKGFQEEIGPCARREPKWSEDRIARLVQECMAEADYRWESSALAAWNKGLPLPEQASEQVVMRACMNDAATAVVAENERLQKRLTEVTSEREALQNNAQQDLQHLRATQDRMADALGEAAKKPTPSAFATANSNGTASTETEQSAHPAIPVNVSAPTPVVSPLPPPSEVVPHSQRTRPESSCRPTSKNKVGGKGPSPLCSSPTAKWVLEGQTPNH
jgi:hypothetical protein